MTKKQLAERIKRAMQDKGIKRKGEYTIMELEELAREVGCDMLYIMEYLRYGTVL